MLKDTLAARQALAEAYENLTNFRIARKSNFALRDFPPAIAVEEELRRVYRTGLHLASQEGAWHMLTVQYLPVNHCFVILFGSEPIADIYGQRLFATRKEAEAGLASLLPQS